MEDVVRFAKPDKSLTRDIATAYMLLQADPFEFDGVLLSKIEWAARKWTKLVQDKQPYLGAQERTRSRDACAMIADLDAGIHDVTLAVFDYLRGEDDDVSEYELEPGRRLSL